LAPSSSSTLFNTALAKFSCGATARNLPLRAQSRSLLRSLGFSQLLGFLMSWDPVYRLVKLIPRGRVLTYGAIARVLRLPGGARTAGRAMAGCPSGKGIPWHRVVGAAGKLLIREPYASLQRKLLETESVQMTERRVNMKLHEWTLPRQKKLAKKRVAKERR
jgi:methylated-DNA-protein-cysteine methyltransferase-like protein